MVGGAAGDVYWVDSDGDEVVEASDQGIDQVFSSISYILTDNVEHLVLGVGAVDGTGNGLANTLVGNGGANHLQGLAGNDLLIGDGGSDALAGRSEARRVGKEGVS